MGNSLIRHFPEIEADVGSDWHLPRRHENPRIINRAIDHVRENKKAQILICVGDLFDVYAGVDPSDEINELVTGLAEVYAEVIVVLGNHDLRGRDKPWSSFHFPQNVISPNGTGPLTIRRDSRTIVAADVFYEMKRFPIDPSLVGSSREAVHREYAFSRDGTYLFGGDTSSFDSFTDAAARALTSQVDILITHVPPHYSLSPFRISEITPEFEKLSRESGVRFLCDDADDRRKASQKLMSLEVFRRWWNSRAFRMGADVLGHLEADPRENVIVVHGHNHHNDVGPRLINGKAVHVITHQPRAKDIFLDLAQE